MTMVIADIAATVVFASADSLAIGAVAVSRICFVIPRGDRHDAHKWCNVNPRRAIGSTRLADDALQVGDRPGVLFHCGPEQGSAKSRIRAVLLAPYQPRNGEQGCCYERK